MLRISWRPKVAPSCQYHTPYAGFISTLHLLGGSKNALEMLRFARVDSKGAIQTLHLKKLLRHCE
jgi:hypothetical protein